ncbi:hypothetical protein Tsubulata_042751, partial [Turnera subulata]
VFLLCISVCLGFSLAVHCWRFRTKAQTRKNGKQGKEKFSGIQNGGDELVNCELEVTLPSDTPVVGCEIIPTVRVTRLTPQGTKAFGASVPDHAIQFSWYRDGITCSCTDCVQLGITGKHSYYCSSDCFLSAWPSHLDRHRKASQAVAKTGDGNRQEPKGMRSCGSWDDLHSSFCPDEAPVVLLDERDLVKLGSSKTYVPSTDDTGFRLRLVSVATDSSSGIPLASKHVLVTCPVIPWPTPRPRSMIQINNLLKSGEVQPSDGVKFTVLSYNILAEMYANQNMYSYCPTWALLWEYRKRNLLNEIIKYDADIVCLQEVQSDHFESFFKPELLKHGYCVLYKHKTQPLYTRNQYIFDGCATFYRDDLFKEITKYEVEFDGMASSVIKKLDSESERQGIIRLKKGNIALVVILEAVEAGTGLRSRICVANTHIHASREFPDTKLCQDGRIKVANLIQGLEKISNAHVPLLICGDFNSVPESDPHNLLVGNAIRLSCQDKQSDPLGIYHHLKLRHAMPLRSAYASLSSSNGVDKQHRMKMNQTNHEPVFTNFTPRFRGTLDYILYTGLVDDHVGFEGHRGAHDLCWVRSSSQINTMDWESLDLRIKTWVEAVKISTSTLFTGERILCDQVFGSSETIRESCFADIFRDGALLLFSFPELVSGKNKKSPPPEKMFRAMDMYTVHWAK